LYSRGFFVFLIPKFLLQIYCSFIERIHVVSLGIYGGFEMSKRAFIRKRDRFGAARDGDAGSARAILKDIQLKLDVARHLNAEEREYLRWAVIRALGSDHDPFGLKPTQKKESTAPLWTKEEFEVWCLRFVDSAGWKLKAGKVQKLQGQNKFDIAQKDLANYLGIHKAKSYLMKVYSKANRKWKLASAVFNILHPKKDNKNKVGLDDAVALVAISHPKMKPKPEEIRKAYLDYYEYIVDSRT